VFDVILFASVSVVIILLSLFWCCTSISSPLQLSALSCSYGQSIQTSAFSSYALSEIVKICRGMCILQGGELHYTTQ